jgi:hypothetical protein
MESSGPNEFGNSRNNRLADSRNFSQSVLSYEIFDWLGQERDAFSSTKVSKFVIGGATTLMCDAHGRCCLLRPRQALPGKQFPRLSATSGLLLSGRGKYHPRRHAAFANEGNLPSELLGKALHDIGAEPFQLGV